MTTTYSAAIQSNSKTTGRLASPTETPTIAAYNFATGASLGAGTWAAIATGAAKVSIELTGDDLDVLFTIVMAAADEDDFDDCVAFHERKDLQEYADVVANIPAETWTYDGEHGRSLTMTPLQIKDLYESDKITIQRGSTQVITIPDITLHAHRQRFGVRKSKNPNTKYTLLIDSSDGLMILNGVALANLEGYTADDATFVYDADEKSLVITLEPNVAAAIQKMQTRDYCWGAQGWNEAGAVSERIGIFAVDEDVVTETELPATEED